MSEKRSVRPARRLIQSTVMLLAFVSLAAMGMSSDASAVSLGQGQVCEPAPGQSQARPVVTQTQSGFALTTGDRIKATFYGREDLNGEYRVREDGSLIIPIVGRMEALGAELGALEQFASRKLSSVSGRAIESSFDIVMRNPIYVLGYVNAPGVFKYQAGATVLHAVSMAGGYFRVPPSSRSTFGVFRETGTLERAQSQLIRALARRARLEAERDQASTITVPDALSARVPPEELRRLIHAETKLMEQRNRALQETITALEKVIKLTKTQIVETEQQYKGVAKQAQLTRQQTKKLSKLSKRGLINNVRVFEIGTRLANYEAEGRLIQARIAQTRQRLENVELRIAELKSERLIEIGNSLIDVDGKIEEARIVIRRSRKLLQEMSGLQPEKGDADKNLTVEPSYTIVRRVQGTTCVFKATEVTGLLPGDVLRVRSSGGG